MPYSLPALSGPVFLWTVATLAFFLTWAPSVLAWEKYRVLAGRTQEVDQLGTCRNVANGKTADLFVPTKTLAEFNAFNSNPSASVTSTACSAFCGEIRSATAPLHSNIVYYSKLNGSGAIANMDLVVPQIGGVGTALDGNEGGFSYTTGRIGTAALFNGTYHQIRIEPYSEINDLTTATWAGWVKPTANTGTIFYKSDGNSTAGWWIDLRDSGDYGKLGLSVVHGNVNLRRYTNSAAIPALNTWYHFAITWAGGTAFSSVKIYINGTEVSSYSYEANAVGTHSTDAAERLWIGPARTGTPGQLVGSLDNIAIWNTALSAAQVSSLYSSQNACP